MKALVIYDSVFGNTEQIARAMGKGLSLENGTRVSRVSEVKPEDLRGLELLIAGSPTRGFRPTAAIVSFLKQIPAAGLKGVKVAAFDTRIPMTDKVPPILRFLVKFFGYAAQPIADRLKKSGGNLVLPPEGFFVTGTEGPLQAGELERAENWARQIAATPKRP